MSDVISIGPHDSGYTLTIQCPCGGAHIVPLDHSGHWCGRCSEHPDKIMSVELNQSEWREIQKARASETVN